MPATAGFAGAVYVSGTSTAMTDEPTTQIGSSKVYYITSAAKRVLDPDTAVVVKDGATTVDAANYTLEHLAGRVTFVDSYTVSGAVTVTASYLPLLEVARVRSVSLNIANNLLDTSEIGNDTVDRIRGLTDASGTLERIDVSTDDLDPGAETVTFEGLLAGGDYTIVAFYPDDTEDHYGAAWARLESLDASADVADLATASINFQGTKPGAATRSWWLGDPTA